MNNDGKIQFGESVWTVEQQIRSFATPRDQELLLKFRLAKVNAEKNYSFLFHHMVRKMDC